LYYQQQTNETAGRGLNMPINRDVRSTKDRKMSPLYYGNTFVENTFVKSLKPQEGDIIIEGRHGQSIRFGSTNKFDKITPKNEWSIGNSNAGDPITIIRNGQNYDTNYQGLHEESAKDHTTIWMTSTQDLSKIISISEFPLNSYGITAQDIQDAEGRITQLTDMPNYNPWNSAEQNDNYTSTSNYASNDKFGMESGQ
jgi:hypothetical protein